MPKQQLIDKNYDVKDVIDVIKQTLNDNFSAFDRLLNEPYGYKSKETLLVEATGKLLSCLKDKLDSITFEEINGNITLLEEATLDMIEEIEGDREKYGISVHLCSYEHRMLLTTFTNLLYGLTHSNNEAFKLVCNNICHLRKKMGEQRKHLEKLFPNMSRKFMDGQKRETEELFKCQINEYYRIFTALSTRLNDFKQSIENEDIIDFDI